MKQEVLILLMLSVLISNLLPGGSGDDGASVAQNFTLTITPQTSTVSLRLSSSQNLGNAGVGVSAVATSGGISVSPGQYTLVSHRVTVKVNYLEQEQFTVTLCDSIEDKYRFGFNGQEKDNELKGVGNSLDFGARIYDSRLGKFLSVDPKASELPELSTYQFGANSPILLIDEDGEIPVAFSRSWFRNFATSKLGLSSNQQIGNLFERVVMTSLQGGDKTIIHNTSLNFPSSERAKHNGGLPASVRPDGIAASVGAKTQKGTVPIKFYGIPRLYEAKITGAVLSKNYRKGQLMGMVDVASKYAEQGKAPMGMLFLIVTKDMKISNDLYDYAASKNVIIKAAVLTYDDETKEFGVSDAKIMNSGSLYGGEGRNLSIQEAFSTQGDIEPDKYEKVTLEDVQKTSSSNSADPDPPQYDDQ